MELPDKEYYTIKQVVEKWKRDGIDCSEDDVLHLIQTHKIDVAFFLPETKFKVNRNRVLPEEPRTDGFLCDPDKYNSFDFENAPIERYSGLFFPCGFCVDDYGLLTNESQWIGNPRGLPFVFDECDRYQQYVELAYLAEPILITSANIVITAKELQRFDAEYSEKTATSHTTTAFDIKEYINQHRGKITENEIIYELRERGFSNNEVGVALGGTYRQNSNALAVRISKIYNKHKKKLEG